MYIMKKLGLIVLASSVIVGVSFGQARRNQPARPKTTGGGANPFGNTTTTPAKPATTPANNNPFGSTNNTQPAASSNPFGGGNAQPPAGNNPFASSNAQQPPAGNNPFANNNTGNTNGQPVQRVNGNIPIVVVPSSTSNPLSDSGTKNSMRMEGAIESILKDKEPLAYDYVREDDAVFRHMIWRVIDAREKINLPFKYPAEEDGGSQLFFAILFKSVSEDSVLAFEDDRFTKPYTLDKFKVKFSGGPDTADVFGLDGQTIIRREVRTKEFPVDSVYQFMLKEEIFFDKEASRMSTRIVGIAPMGPTILPSGKVVEGPSFPYFWLYYPDIRRTLAKKQVYNPKNMGARMSWDDLFENRIFSSYITKTKMDNASDRTLLDIKNKDYLFRLLEGEKIKEKLFNYEQNLWSY